MTSQNKYGFQWQPYNYNYNFTSEKGNSHESDYAYKFWSRKFSIQGLSSTLSKFQALSRHWIVCFKFKDIQGHSRFVRPLSYVYIGVACLCYEQKRCAEAAVIPLQTIYLFRLRNIQQVNSWNFKWLKVVTANSWMEWNISRGFRSQI